MRKIQFRAWNKEKQVMVYEDEDNSAEYWDGVNISNVQMVNARLQNSNYVWLQNTGLTDKNGIEIFEGDLLSAFYGTQLTEVKWNAEYGLYEVALQLSGGSKIANELLGNHLDVVEVIGNRYENHELLETDSNES